ncbi:MAG: D-cysteine desulfhydrase family protein [Comamonas sp.]
MDSYHLMHSTTSSPAPALAALQRLAALPRYPLGFGPTPLTLLQRTTARCAGPQIWIKRDDCTGLATGGNKTRKLEFLLGEAQALGCDTLISQGALQSNHARQVAAAGAVAGMKVHLVLSDAVPGRTADYTRVGNTQLCRLLGAQVQQIAGDADANAVCAALAEQLRSQGARPYVIPMGGSNGMGALGYAVALVEIVQQMQALDAPLDTALDAVVLASGSGGTQVGLMLGAWLQGWQGRVHGVSVGPTQEVLQSRIAQALAEAAQHLGLPADAGWRDVPAHADVDFKGPHYGVPDAQTLAALEWAAREEGVLLDPVYSAKGFAGLLQACSPGGVLHGARHVVFVHTGGTAAMSAYPDVAA